MEFFASLKNLLSAEKVEETPVTICDEPNIEFTIRDKEGKTLSFGESSFIGKYSRLYKKNLILDVPFKVYEWHKNYDFFDMSIEHMQANMSQCIILKEVNITTPELFNLFKSFEPPSFVLVERNGNMISDENLEEVWKYFSGKYYAWYDVYKLKTQFEKIAKALQLDEKREWEKFLNVDPLPHKCKMENRKGNRCCRSKMPETDHCSYHRY